MRLSPLLAESLNGWLFAAAAFFVALIASLMALCAIGPARRRNRRMTLALAAPALVIGVVFTIAVGYGFITDGMRDPDYSISDFAVPWLMMAGPPLGSSLLAILILWVRMKTPAA
jgi:ammonia channel protein AmtB